MPPGGSGPQSEMAAVQDQLAEARNEIRGLEKRLALAEASLDNRKRESETLTLKCNHLFAALCYYRAEVDTGDDKKRWKCMKLYIQGYKLKDIAKKVGLESEPSVSYHISTACKEWGVNQDYIRGITPRALPRRKTRGRKKGSKNKKKT